MMNKSDNSGLTLLEAIVAIAIASSLVAISSTVYSVSQTTYKKTETKAELSQNGRIAMERISRDLRQALKIATELPADDSQPQNLPQEIEFQDGHDQSAIKYIRYYLDGSEIKKQIIAYAFADNPQTYVYYNAKDQQGRYPDARILEENVIGEYASRLQFWGGSLISINLVLSKDGQIESISTAVYGRNL